mmetsp:Transcript_16260/g.32991  ORF Transcript_16260/g.32991 Transcript_16260/m.32991 type:complete len:98 (-) Transcript_16260:13-306(-)
MWWGSSHVFKGKFQGSPNVQRQTRQDQEAEARIKSQTDAIEAGNTGGKETTESQRVIRTKGQEAGTTGPRSTKRYTQETRANDEIQESGKNKNKRRK